jgi:hypothetical protein
LLEYGRQADPARAAELETRFREERAWLDRLAARTADLHPRPSMLDPSAWFLLLELDQHGLTPDLLVSPLGPDDDGLLRQVFDQADERLAASLLPELLPRMELRSTAIWRQLLEQLPEDPALSTVVLGLQADWFDPWIAAEPPAPAGGDRNLIDQSLEDLRAIAGVAIAADPPDALRLKRVRFERAGAAGAERSGGAGCRLPARRPPQWTESVRPRIPGLYGRPPVDRVRRVAGSRARRNRLPLAPAALADGIVARFLEAHTRGIRRGRLAHQHLAAVFDVMQYLQSAAPEPARLAALRRDLADAVAQLVLLIPDMNYYFEQPVRERIAEEINICISIAASRGSDGQPTLSRQQFDGCLESLVGMANQQASRSELAGDPRGPFGTDQLRREMMLTPWQRINYMLGYLYDRHSVGCEPPAARLANPLEWASLATVIVWFAQQAPVYLATPENEARLASIRRRGMELLSTWTRQVDCISGTGTGLNDPVARGLADYRLALDDLVAGLREAELEFRAAHLKPGSDVMLHGDALQHTAFRGEDVQIGPCDSARICEMSGKLEATRALIGLFPDPYLIADQTGLARSKSAGDNMQWIERRSQPVPRGRSPRGGLLRPTELI